MKEYKQLVWEERQSGNITTWRGKINGRVFFEINQFKNEMFTDSFIMTSNIVPLNMKKSEDLEDIQWTAQILLEAFLKSLEEI